MLMTMAAARTTLIAVLIAALASAQWCSVGRVSLAPASDRHVLANALPPGSLVASHKSARISATLGCQRLDATTAHAIARPQPRRAGQFVTTPRIVVLALQQREPASARAPPLMTT